MVKETLPLLKKDKNNQERSLKSDIKCFCFSDKMQKIFSLASLDTKL